MRGDGVLVGVAVKLAVADPRAVGVAVAEDILGAAVGDAVVLGVTVAAGSVAVAVPSGVDV